MRSTLRVWRRLAVAVVGALAAVAAMAVVAGAQPAVEVEEDVKEYVVGPPASFPEGVVYDSKTRAFYGGSATDGTLYRATLDDPQAQLFLPAGGPGGRTEADGVNVDKEGRLYVAGGSTGSLFVYDIETREQVARFNTGAGGFINDLTITTEGDVYFTDSFRPFLYRVTREQVESGGGAPEAIPLAPEVAYQPGFNANGIRATASGKYLILADTNDGRLYRVEVDEDSTEREIRRIQTDAPTDNPDGLELRGHTLYSVDNQNELIVKVLLSEDFLEGTVVSNTTTPEFHTPTTVSIAGDRLLVSNAEFFDQSEPGPPYYVVSIPRP